MWRTLLGEDINSETAAARGYRVVAPAKIDDATERARLEREVERLRDMLRRAMEHGVNGSDYYHAMKAGDLGDEIRAALTPGATP